ncbi:mitotic checkpoint serine/threonine-protein kinase BUB1 beta [Conger conger]|uniref:mitotic checkpoint serine/threonine-protein kinase BUB1 beta n=1 Tax=Conger conger TaxID=82655 RepID=UPI002A5B1106|nr:mitotic checkpoint serine/threonine-protein kinase BUB1 beta [Conger conger]
MAEGEAEWELSKENIQPLRQGRAISALHQALSQQQEGTNYTAIQQTQQAFESELRIYNGDDPLDVWDRYIRWTQQTYPQGGKESNLSVLLERAVMLFAEEKKYHNDIRYVSLWIKFAENSTEPMDFYTYMNGQGIGVVQAAFYIAWSEEYEKRGNFKKADTVYMEGIKCGAEPGDKLQQYHKAFQARVSRQVVLNMASGGQEDSPEPAPPQRSSLVDLKHRGKKKAIVPINRTGVSVSHHAHGLSLNLPAASHHAQNSQTMVFDENRAPVAQSSDPRPEQWLAPPVARSKENDLMPEKWTNVRMPKKNRFGHTMVVPPSKPNFEPFVEESDQPPAVTPCKINPAVNRVLSARKPSKEENPLERLQEQQQVPGPTREQSMYCKELLLSGATEFCFEELRTERYRKKLAQDLEDKEANLRRVKDDLRRRIEERQRLLLEKSHETDAGHQAQRCVVESQAVQHVEHSLPGPSSSMSQGSVAGFKVFDESNASSSGRICPLKVYRNTDSGDSVPKLETIQTNEAQSKAMPFAVFDESAMCEQPQEEVPMVVSQPSARKPLCAILKPQGDGPATRPSESDCLEGIEPLNEDAIIGSYRNNTLCHIPDDTCEFARAAQLASTPFSGGLNRRPSLGMESGLGEDLCAAGASALKDVPTFTSAQAGFEGALRVKKLSPIQEASLEDGSYSGSSVSSSSLAGASSMRTMNLSKPVFGHAEASQDNEPNTPETEVKDPTSENVRRLALEKIDLSSFPHFHSKSGPLPTVVEHEVLSAGDEAFVILSGIISSESSTVHFGQTKYCENVVIKVDLHPIPWDFYINTQLRNRLGSDSTKYFNDQSRCFLYEDGCVTVSWGHYQGTLQECLAKSPLQESVAALLVIELLELVGQMHSCHLVHGDLRPNTLFLRHRTGCEGLEGVLRAVDFSCSLDLDLQPEVTSVLGHPGAQAFLQQGVLSSASSPYQIDLLGIAETVHVMLEKRSMQLVCRDSEWELAEDLQVAYGNPDDVWRNFFRKILNPGSQSTVSVLSELQQLMKKHFNYSIEDELAFHHE